jgi:hypothetical protein
VAGGIAEWAINTVSQLGFSGRYVTTDWHTGQAVSSSMRRVSPQVALASCLVFIIKTSILLHRYCPSPKRLCQPVSICPQRSSQV